MSLFTLDDLEFMGNEEHRLFGSQDKTQESPSSSTIKSLLAYSSALSIRKSALLNQVTMLLN